MAVLNVNLVRAQGTHAHGHLQRADASATVPFGSASPVATIVLQDNKQESTVKALAALVVIFGLLLLGVAAWRIGVWRRKKIRAASTSVNVVSMQKKQSRKAVPIAFDGSASEHSESEKPSVNIISPGAMRVVSPPPTYATAYGATNPTQRPSPPALAITTRPPGIQTPVTTKYNPRSPLVPTPRTSSFRPNFDTKTPITAVPKSSARKNLPRMVIVKVSFVPTLADELPIKVGEKLVLLEEYEDGWCQVQRASQADGDKGVVPQFCVQ
ncbi:hypothetical protein B0H21DRAFT_3661 [Amylocystis lapponica]|nr:hypothetical protein B0H21DRAFT_3661 [Amylocystis lapponica]